ncbi:TBC1 domain family member 17 [Histomonas meleagridis]|nr:TBC1 domain family member 17 [Histomonas meleagridis]
MTFAGGARRFQLCTIEPTIDKTNGQTGGSNGTLVLSRFDEIFMISWTPISGSPMHHLAVMQQTQNTESEESWEFNKSFKQECVHIKLLQLHEDFSLTIYGYNEGEERRFSYEPMEFISVTELVEQLLINGIAVPSADKSYSLQFYKRCHRGVYPYTPPHIQLGFDTSSEPSTKNFPEDLKKFWDCLHSFFLTLIIHLDNSDTLPRDPQFPLAEAARANHKRILEEIDEYSDHIGQEYQKITSEEWGNLFDEEGRIKNFEEFKLRLFHAGIDTEILNKALPFAFGVYPSNSTTIEREKLDKELSKEYKQLVNQVEKLTPDQINNNKRISSAFRVIKHDVSRTDRQLLAFKDNDAEGLKMVTQLLRTYCIFNPPIGYLQGMNDLFVPILLAFLNY